MYTKLKRSIVQFITMMGLAMVITGLLGLSPAQAADGETNNVISASDTTKSLDAEVSDRTDAPSTVSGDVADVLSANAGFIGKSKKVKACKAYAEKIEQQAPPRDPQALCEGDLKVRLYGKIVAACPTGYLGAKVTLMASLRQTVKARAFAKSIASGRVRTWAEFKIRDLAKIKGKTHIECVLIPVVTPPPPVEHDECPSIPGNQPKGYNCNPTPPPPPVYDHCPNLPGDQPSGYNCYPTPPPHDECPNIPGNQPVGYDCSPPVKPTIVDKTRVNDLRPGASTDICATADFDKGHMGTLFFSFESGAITGTNPVTVSDLQQGCATLVAPTEPGWYTYNVTATDSVNGLSATATSASFEVWVSPPPPN